MARELPKVYDPKEVESRIYTQWEQNGCFRGKADPDKKPFTIVMPPPNVTGVTRLRRSSSNTCSARSRRVVKSRTRALSPPRSRIATP